MKYEPFILRGKVVQMARNLKDVSAREFAEKVNIHPVTLSTIERETRSLSTLNNIRLKRGLRDIGVTDQQIVAIQLIVEHWGGAQVEEQTN